MEATDAGKPLYEACAFKYTEKKDPSPRWSELEKYMDTPVPNHLMWRQARGVDKAPSEQRQE
ncbi:uncharacterized protein KY384_001757 [Bacidia gigantensis]|uniref:uncharacterized protein n=1 Tax=Bacidia gigantensis TaxID=2732470 RepID=UPI001D058B54|nr:uncharacterized protein KY384_001757 [Bacidia gigantensis]KAG8532975.1 hypothetical protein KY384_001757 [Bacidia gigantensis]